MSTESKMDVEERARTTATAWMYKNLKYLLLVLALGFGAWGGKTAMHEYNLKKDQAVRDQLFKYITEIEQFEEDQMKMIASKNSADKKSKEKPAEFKKTKEVFEDKLSAPAAALEAEIIKNKNMQSASRAAVILSDYYAEYGLQEKAKALLKQMDAGVSGDMMQGLAQMQYAAMLSGQTDCDKALSVYSNVLSNKKWDFLHSQALLRSVACHVELGQYPQANTKLSLVLADHPESAAARSAKTYQRVIKLKSAGGSQ